MLKHLNSPIWWGISSFPPLNSFMWLTVSSIFSWGYDWNSFVLVEASLLVQEFCFTSLPVRLVNSKLGQRILIYVSKASTVVRSIFIYTPSQKKSVKSRWWTTIHYCTIIRKFQEELWNMMQGQVGIMWTTPNKAPEEFRAATGIALERGRVCICPSLLHIHSHTYIHIYTYTQNLHVNTHARVKTTRHICTTT